MRELARGSRRLKSPVNFRPGFRLLLPYAFAEGSSGYAKASGKFANERR